MVMAARRAYADAIRWMKRARPPGLDAGRLTRRVLRFCFGLSFILLGIIGVVSPSRFGSPGMKPMASLQWWAVAGVVAMALVLVITSRRRVRRTVELLLEPVRRPLDHLPSFEPVTEALDSCPAALRTRFAFGWVWGPAIAVVAATTFLAATSYFIVDAILARLQIGWQQPVLAVANAALAFVVLRVVARRLATWRLALSIQRAVNHRY